MSREIISGFNPVFEVLKAGRRNAYKIWITNKNRGKLLNSIVREADQRKIPIVISSRENIAKISRVEKNQGIAAQVDAFRYSSLRDILKVADDRNEKHFILVLDNIVDPQNLGSIIRSAYLSGIHGVVIPERNSAPVGPAAIRASAGAVEYMLISKVTNIARTLELFKEKGIWIAGVEVNGDNIYSHDFSDNYALVIGSEGKGMRRLVRSKCDYIVSIPMKPIVSGGVDSYNASVASGIALSTARRSRIKAV